MSTTLSDADIAGFAAEFVRHEGRDTFNAPAAWWREQVARTSGIPHDVFIPAVLAAAEEAGKLSTPTPQLVCWESMPDGSAPVRLSFSIKCF